MRVQKPNIMIVDDDPILRRVLEQTLSRAGFAAVTAESGAAALTAVRERPVDIVLSDLAMPGMSGLELLEALREAGQHCPFIVISSYSSKDNILEALRMGAFDFIAKPFHSSTVSRLLDEANRVNQRRSSLLQQAPDLSPAFLSALALVSSLAPSGVGALDQRTRDVLACDGDVARFLACTAADLASSRSSIENLQNFQDRPWELGNLLRIYHALRGAAAALDMTELVGLFTVLEDFYAYMRVRPEELSTDMIVSLRMAHAQLGSAVEAPGADLATAFAPAAQTIAKLEIRLAKTIAQRAS